MTMEPPVAKYRLSLEITGNSHDEIERELRVMVNGGYLDKTNGYRRYERELNEWFDACHAARREAQR